MCKSCRQKVEKIRKSKQPIKIHLSQIKDSAKRRNHIWNLEDWYAYTLMTSPCYYCGSLSSKGNGLDRMDSNYGYTKNNVVSCCKICNTAKLDLSLVQFKKHIEKMYNWMYEL